ncbi:hypothetical protein [Rhodanobacter soli]|uniref:hypothetical protein n=1 Tax=Rhodanobacter soli TaxID=590609 RepID=UPI0031CFB76F
MFKSVFAIALLLLSSHACAQAQGVPAQAGPTSSEIALRVVEALDSANWELAAQSMDGVPPERLQEFWTKWGRARGSEKAWAGPVRVEPRHYENGQFAYDLVILPIVRTRGHIEIRFRVAKGKVKVEIAPSYAVFGPYTALAGKTHVWPDGTRWNWYVSPSGSSVVSEVRGPAGQLQQMDLIKAVGDGSLVMLRWPYCPDGVCGQTGTLQKGVVSWKEPKASGGHSGNYMDAKVWMERNALVTYTTDPAPYGGVQFYDQYPELAHMRPKPIRIELERISPYTPEQRAESHKKIAELEPLIEIEVAKAVAKQASIGQAIADAQAEKQRSSERVRSFNQMMGSLNEVLTDANVVATANEAQSRANLDATIAAMNAQAEAQRAMPAPVQQPTVTSQVEPTAPATAPPPTEDAGSAAGSVNDAGRRLSEAGRPATLNPTDGNSTCPMVPRTQSGTSGIHESKADAEAQAKAYVRCGEGGIASMNEPTCTTHMKTLVTMVGGKTTSSQSPRWVCGVVATCTIGRPVCAEGATKGSSAQ